MRVKHFFKNNGLAIAMFAIFDGTIIGMSIVGWQAENQSAQLHDDEVVSVFNYIGSSQFWFESLQNWQSEFLAVGSLLVLSIYLRERGSQQSKPVGTRYDRKTGE